MDGNSAETGGGACLVQSNPNLTHIALTNNFAGHSGGGLGMSSSDPIISHATLTGNSATQRGGGLYLHYSAPALIDSVLLGNSAEYGGGMSLWLSDLTLSRVILTGNSATADGGGIYLENSNPTLRHVTLVANSAAIDGGGMYMNTSYPILSHVIMSHNAGADLWGEASTPTLTWCDLYNPHGASHNLRELDESNLEVDPYFVALTLDGDASNDDLHLHPGSPLIDAGAPDLDGDGASWDVDLDDQDPDGSRPDIGAFGGPAADWSGYEDVDEDGLYDPWEVVHGLDPEVDNSATDQDVDGATDEEEFAAGTDPQSPDTDTDGHEDGVELEAGTDPLNMCSQPGVEGRVTLRVPEDYATLQEAIEAAPSGCRIEVAAGRYFEKVEVNSKELELVGLGGVMGTVLDGAGQGPLVYASHATLKMEGFTITGGAAEDGGGVYLRHSDGALRDLVIEDNSAQRGGGLFLHSSVPTLGRVTMTNNSARSGGGMYLSHSNPTMSHVTLIGNSATDSGGGMLLSSSHPMMSHLTIAGSSAKLGGGMYLDESDPTISHAILTASSSSYGGGIYMDSAAPNLSHVTVAGNSSTIGGGLYASQSHPTLTHVILSHNHGANLWATNNSTPILSWCDLYTSAGVSHNLPNLHESNLEVTPLFVAFSMDGDASNDDLHLRPTSPLIDAGASDLDGDSELWHTDLDDQDPDGTRADIGGFGGPGADWSGYSDTDADGLYDSWEVARGLSPVEDTSEEDPDADGATNTSEFAAGTDPHVSDCDADGHNDGAELQAGKDPLNRCSQPGTEGWVALHVPEDYVTLQEAVDASPSGCRIEVAAGRYHGRVEIKFKAIQLVGMGGIEGTTLVGTEEGSVVDASSATLEMDGFTITGGSANLGGGIDLTSTNGALSRLWITGNLAKSGGGVSMSYSSPTMTHVTLTGNTAFNGGGMYLLASNPAITYVIISGNYAAGDDYTMGGGMHLQHSNPSLSHVNLIGNSALGSLASGGGMYLYGSNPVVSRSLIAYNTGFYNIYSEYETNSSYFSHCAIYDPEKDNFSGIELDSTNLTADPRLLVMPIWDESEERWRITDHHLALDSPLVDAGSSDAVFNDPDGTQADIGMYGGPHADEWDRDGDGYPDWFWPGTIQAAPPGFSPEHYDADDLDPNLH